MVDFDRVNPGGLLDVTGFERTRRIAGGGQGMRAPLRGAAARAPGKGADAEAKTAFPAPGENVRETISRTLKEGGVPHSLAEAGSLARGKVERDANERAAMVRENSAEEGWTESLRNSADPEAQKESPSGPLNTREMASRARVDDEDIPRASVSIEAGEVVERRPNALGVNAPFAATHYAPPSSIAPGTDGREPMPQNAEDRDYSSYADPDAQRKKDEHDAEVQAQNLAIETARRKADVERGERHARMMEARGETGEVSKDAARSTKQLAKDAAEREADAEEAREIAADHNIALGAVDVIEGGKHVDGDPETMRKPATGDDVLKGAEKSLEASEKEAAEKAAAHNEEMARRAAGEADDQQPGAVRQSLEERQTVIDEEKSGERPAEDKAGSKAADERAETEKTAKATASHGKSTAHGKNAPKGRPHRAPRRRS